MQNKSQNTSGGQHMDFLIRNKYNRNSTIISDLSDAVTLEGDVCSYGFKIKS